MPDQVISDQVLITIVTTLGAVTVAFITGFFSAKKKPNDSAVPSAPVSTPPAQPTRPADGAPAGAAPVAGATGRAAGAETPEWYEAQILQWQERAWALERENRQLRIEKLERERGGG